MALTVQSGSTVVADADSYIALADAETYATERGFGTAWSGATDAAKEAALRYATQWLDERYDWLGIISTTATNRLKWPRLYAVDMDGREWTGVPQALKDAVVEVALQHLSTGVNEVHKRGGAIKRVRVEGAVEREYFDGAPANRSWPFVDRLLRNLYLGSPSRVRVLRS